MSECSCLYICLIPRRYNNRRSLSRGLHERIAGLHLASKPALCEHGLTKAQKDVTLSGFRGEVTT